MDERMSEETGEPRGDLAGRLADIEALPLAERAAQYAVLHDDLARALEIPRAPSTDPAADGSATPDA